MWPARGSEEYQEAPLPRQPAHVREHPQPAGRVAVDSVRLPLAVPLPPRQPGGLEPQGAGFRPGIPQESVVSDERLLHEKEK